MANVIKHKRGSGSDPTASDLVVGELAIRTDTGKLFTKMDSGALAEIAGGGSDIAINTLSSSSGTGGGSATFNGSAYRFTLSSPPSVSAQQLLVSINGVIQKPVAGTGQPSEGFSVDGTDIILGDAPATGSDFFILTFRSLGVSVPADNSVTSAKIADGAIVNADINASAAIAGSKLNPVGLANVGIGTTSPSQKLHISSGTASGALQVQSNGSNNYFAAVQSAGAFANGSSAGSLVIRSQGGIHFTGNDGASVQATLTSGGNLGIGTTSPDGKLDVRGTIFVNGDGTGGRIFASSGNLSLSDGNGRQVLRIDDPGAGNSHAHIFDSNGRLGIGTTSPSVSLDIESTTPTIRLTDSDASGTPECEIRGGGGDLIFSADRDDEKASTVMQFQTDGSTAMTIDSSQNVQIPNDSVFLQIGAGQDLDLHHNGTNSYIRNKTGDLHIRPLVAEEGIILEPQGNVKLYHSNSQKFRTYAAGVEVTGNVLIPFDGSSTTNALRIGASQDLTIYHDGSSSRIIAANHDLILQSNGYTIRSENGSSTFATIDSAGRFRIGNENLTSDSKADHLIVGTTSGDNGLTIFSGTGNTGNIFFADTSTSASGNRMGTITYNHSANFMRFSTNGNQQRMRIDLNGRVAINTDIGSNEADEYGGFVSMKPNHDFTDGATNLSTSALKAVLRVRTSANSSMSLYMGGLDTARPYLQVGNLAGASGATASYDLYLNPYGGNVFFGRGIKLGSSNDHNSAKIVVQSTGNTSATNSVFFKNSDETESFRIRDDGVFFTGVDGASPYNLTSSDSANVVVTSSGSLRRSTSSVRYKKDIADATFGLADVLKLKPKTFKNNATGEFEDDKTYAGFTAEDIHDLGLTEFVQYNEDNEPDALAYGNMVALMAKAIQELNAKVEALEAK